MSRSDAFMKSPEMYRAGTGRLRRIQRARYETQRALFPIVAGGSRALARAVEQHVNDEQAYTPHTFAPAHLDVVAPEQPTVMTPQAAEIARLRDEVAHLHAIAESQASVLDRLGRSGDGLAA